ncbi:NAD(P)-dependent dehydrogenase (short-subunit alcohol dehydrogenase family) [Microbacterium sp. BE35]|uniref:SDR family NAD(P)-dependent oxidoreductase n=1 Tax=Microbacterium sp. BE35 TaxID=2817773 RepID=UPI002857DA3B|nr:SDR family oxidoreductase [Microbacterium sp. BE35]MDR7188180.1 NAD(P)-dependent dehydrogenase (short-subunit alcohol dehydrogenase family) [Microbacterium sp. BE35]
MTDTKVAVVTGASSGNGRAIALRLARDGYSVVCSDLREQPRAGGYDDSPEVPTHELIQNEGGAATFVAADTSNFEQMSGVVETAVGVYGRLDVFVNNAGVFFGLGNIVEETEEVFDKTIGVNLKGVWNGSKLAITQFLKQEPRDGTRGVVVNIASIGGLVGLPEEPAYCASKGGVVNLSRQLAVDFAEHRIRVNTICPGFLETAMAREFLDDPTLNAGLHAQSPWPNLGTAEDVAKAVSFLAGDQSSWVTGANLVVDGGFTIR